MDFEKLQEIKQKYLAEINFRKNADGSQVDYKYDIMDKIYTRKRSYPQLCKVNCQHIHLHCSEIFKNITKNQFQVFLCKKARINAEIRFKRSIFAKLRRSHDQSL